MKSKRLVKAMLTVSACAFALVIAVGCSSGAASGSGSASGSAASSSTASASAAPDKASPEAASSKVASSAAASSEAASSAAASSEAASSAASSAAASSEAASSAAAQTKEEAAIADGSQVFKGTVRVLDGPALLELQAIDIDPAAAGGGGTYAVLVFDQDTDVTGMSADGSGERTEAANMLGIGEYTDYGSFVVEYGDLEMWKSLDGQQVTIAAQAEDIMFPSDVRLPIGQPQASTVIVL